MQTHMREILACTELLIPFFDAVLQSNWEQAKILKLQITTLEEKADELKKNIRLSLPNSLFLPVSRSDLLGLLTAQDKIASKAKHIAQMIISRNMSFPGQVQQDIAVMINKGVQATGIAYKAISELDELVETGFKGKEVKVIENIVIELDNIERDSDDMQTQLRINLFAIEKELDPIDVIFYYKIIDWLAELTDRAQHVGQRLESLLAN